MGLTKPWEQPTETEAADPAPDPEPEPGPPQTGPGQPGRVAEVRTLPGVEAASGSGAVAPSRAGLAASQAAQAAREAGGTAAAVWQGTAYRDRPPSLRDQRVYLARVQAPAGVPALRRLVQAVGAVGLALNAYDYTRAWASRRPARLLLGGLALRLWPLLLTIQLVWGWPL